ncbi:hypothetical protein GGI18_000319 [Coemansia linderi]|uniref:Uncharacterized protein n=1 Tax=Coemansia linderi TaxID=2663919 RepID=A0ACC1KPQ1_9FUNG|nr:hypothetical protein GGI18_000319 [Coemansia linderi]
MGGPRKTSTKMTAPRRGGSSSRGASSRGGRGGSHNRPAGKSRFTERSKAAPKGDEDENSHDVFEAEDHEDYGKRRRRNVERVDVRDYEIENIDSEDDEEIDSDDAFNDSDEERFASYKRTSGSSNKDDEASDASEEEDEDEDDEDLVDLSEMLDASESEEEESPKSAKPSLLSPSALGFDDLAVDGEEEDEESDDQAFAGMDSDSDASVASDDDEEEAAERLSKLDGFVTSISARAPRRRFVTETGGGYAEDENAIGSGMSTKGVTLGINDLLGSLGGHVDEAEGSEHQGLRQIRDLKNQVTKLDRAAKKAGAGVVAAPLAKRLQDQMDRKVAYEKTKKSVSEWQPTVDSNRAAEYLSFPMNQPERDTLTTASLVSNLGVKNDLEAQIQSVLQESGMTDEQQRQYEELELKSLSPEEVRQRQRELRMMRELMFRSERKAKRMAKIKSKAYRRILKKDKDRAQEKAMERLKEDDPEMHAMLVEKMARSQAEERMSLRHKNTSKWAREMSKRSHGDEDTQQALRDQLEQHDSLKRKVYDIGSGEELSDYEAGKDSDGDESDSDADMSFAAVKSRALQKIAAEMGKTDTADDTPHKTLFGMKFMQNALQRKEEAAQRDAQMMHDEFESLEADVDEDGVAISLKRPSAKKADKVEAKAPGRMSFGAANGGKKQKQKQQDDGSDGDEPAKRVRLNEAGQVGQVASGGGHRVRLAEPISVDSASIEKKGRGSKKAEPAAHNPWVSDDVSAHSGQRGGKLNELSKDSTKLDKLSARLRSKRKGGAVGNTGGAEESVLLDVNQTLSLDRPAADHSDGEAGSDDDIRLEHTGGKRSAVNPNAFSQRELVEQAFAEDNIVEAEFAAEKEAAMDDEAPKDLDVTLPGWGSWGGTGVKPSSKKIIRKAPEGSGVLKQNRMDAKMGEVIINQKQAKSSNKYYASNLPFPFYTPKQYEETLQAPLGKEWNTAKSHSKSIKPRVLVKAGKIIDPLSIPSKKRQ